MDIVTQKNVIIECHVDEIIHPTPTEEKKRIDKMTEVWTVFRTSVKKGHVFESFSCVGMALPLQQGDLLSLVGDWVDSGKFGYQFQFRAIQKQIPTERNAVINFLVKNINGVGAVTAEKIADILGMSAIDSIKSDYTVLEKVPGISAKKAASIGEQIIALGQSLDDLTFFAKTGLGAARTTAIKMAYAAMEKETGKKINVIERITKNPYCLIDDVKGIGFLVADRVALNIGFPEDDPRRIRAGLEYTLKEEVDTAGNIWMKRDQLCQKASNEKHLNLPSSKIKKILDEMIKKDKLVEEDERIYLPTYYKMEFYIANKLKEIQEYEQTVLSPSFIEDGIKKAEISKKRTLDEGQKEAVKLCIKNNLAIVTGGPGVGKTTTLDILLYFLENECNMEVTMAAPTGRAAKRMTEQTGRSASTIHSLSLNKSMEDFVEGNKRHVIVIDESSMVDINVMTMVLNLCHSSTKLLFVGDVDQLPSIGPGQILRDMIDSGVIATARLTKIHRQSADSHIITNAHLCISGHHLEKETNKDFFMVEPETEEECLTTLINYVTYAYPKRFGVNPSEIQILAPLKSGALGVNNLNKEMQSALNPHSISKREYEIRLSDRTVLLREGDRVIQTKNDYKIPCEDGSQGVFNGEIGTLREIVNEYGLITFVVEFPDKTAHYDTKMIRNLTLAYCITIHKSQGSEFKTVILPLFKSGMPSIYNRNLLYTAITRAKSHCCIIGKRTTTNNMIHNNKINKRNTTLVKRLRNE